MIDSNLSLQEQFAPKSICFGCGPANESGLHVRSFPDGEGLVCRWQPEPKYQAFPGILYGGLIASLLDCHCNWTASWHLKNRNGLDAPPCTVTAEMNVKFMQPTPADSELILSAKVIDSRDTRATVEGQLSAAGKVCALFKGTFVAVKEGHPAFHRW